MQTEGSELVWLELWKGSTGRPMKQPKGQRVGKRRMPDPATERREEYRAVIEPDPLLKEVGEANEHIANPEERKRVVPSRPC